MQKLLSFRIVRGKLRGMNHVLTGTMVLCQFITNIYIWPTCKLLFIVQVIHQGNFLPAITGMKILPHYTPGQIIYLYSLFMQQVCLVLNGLNITYKQGKQRQK